MVVGKGTGKTSGKTTKMAVLSDTAQPKINKIFTMVEFVTVLNSEKQMNSQIINFIKNTSYVSDRVQTGLINAYNRYAESGDITQLTNASINKFVFNKTYITGYDTDDKPEKITLNYNIKIVTSLNDKPVFTNEFLKAVIVVESVVKMSKKPEHKTQVIDIETKQEKTPVKTKTTSAKAKPKKEQVALLTEIEYNNIYNKSLNDISVDSDLNTIMNEACSIINTTADYNDGSSTTEARKASTIKGSELKEYLIKNNTQYLGSYPNLSYDYGQYKRAGLLYSKQKDADKCVNKRYHYDKINEYGSVLNGYTHKGIKLFRTVSSITGLTSVEFTDEFLKCAVTDYNKNKAKANIQQTYIKYIEQAKTKVSKPNIETVIRYCMPYGYTGYEDYIRKKIDLNLASKIVDSYYRYLLAEAVYYDKNIDNSKTTEFGRYNYAQYQTAMQHMNVFKVKFKLGDNKEKFITMFRVGIQRYRQNAGEKHPEFGEAFMKYIVIEKDNKEAKEYTFNYEILDKSVTRNKTKYKQEQEQQQAQKQESAKKIRPVRVRAIFDKYIEMYETAVKAQPAFDKHIETLYSYADLFVRYIKQYDNITQSEYSQSGRRMLHNIIADYKKYLNSTTDKNKETFSVFAYKQINKHLKVIDDNYYQHRKNADKYYRNCDLKSGSSKLRASDYIRAVEYLIKYQNFIQQHIKENNKTEISVFDYNIYTFSNKSVSTVNPDTGKTKNNKLTLTQINKVLKEYTDEKPKCNVDFYYGDYFTLPKTRKEAVSKAENDYNSKHRNAFQSHNEAHKFVKMWINYVSKKIDYFNIKINDKDKNKYNKRIRKYSSGYYKFDRTYRTQRVLARAFLGNKEYNNRNFIEEIARAIYSDLKLYDNINLFGEDKSNSDIGKNIIFRNIIESNANLMQFAQNAAEAMVKALDNFPSLHTQKTIELEEKIIDKYKYTTKPTDVFRLSGMLLSNTALLVSQKNGHRFIDIYVSETPHNPGYKTSHGTLSNYDIWYMLEFSMHWNISSAFMAELNSLTADRINTSNTRIPPVLLYDYKYNVALNMLNVTNSDDYKDILTNMSGAVDRTLIVTFAIDNGKIVYRIQSSKTNDTIANGKKGLSIENKGTSQKNMIKQIITDRGTEYTRSKKFNRKQRSPEEMQQYIERIIQNVLDRYEAHGVSPSDIKRIAQYYYKYVVKKLPLSNATDEENDVRALYKALSTYLGEGTATAVLFGRYMNTPEFENAGLELFQQRDVNTLQYTMRFDLW